MTEAQQNGEYREPLPDQCAMCHQPAQGFAMLGGERYCHGDNDPSPTCYERAQDPWEFA